MIRVAIVTDSPVLRAGLASVLGAAAGDADVRVVEGDEAEVVIIVPRAGRSRDESLLSREGDLDAGRRPTMVLLERLDADAARDAYASGASAVLSIDANGEELLAAVRAVAAGLVVVPSAVSSELIEAPAPVETSLNDGQAVALTPREGQVLTLLAQGFANKMIAARLGITEHTVKTHIAAVYEKLNAGNRAEAVVAAARQGLITL